MRLKDRVALITGAGRGIGRAIALGYAQEGASLALAARTVSELEETARQVEALGAAACVIRADVTDQSQVEEMVARTLDRFSTIDILVNNAGHRRTGWRTARQRRLSLGTDHPTQRHWGVPLQQGGHSHHAGRGPGQDH